MSPKKQSSKKLDLSSLGRLTHDVISESDKLGATKEKFSLSSTESISTNSPVIEELASSPVDKPSVDTSQWKSKSQLTEVEPPKGLVEATNSAGEVLKPGDKILAHAPWGTKELAEIVTIYQDKEGDLWVNYVPLEVAPSNWSWLGGCSRAKRLIRG